MSRARNLILLAFAACALGAPNVSASPITIPPLLAPGSSYLLAFMTLGTRDATSTNIADYDSFVSTVANSDPTLAALGTTWKVIGSTSAVNAAAHISVGPLPVYNLAGQLVANNSADLFDGSIANGVHYAQDGSDCNVLCGQGNPFTGTNGNGTTAVGAELGCTGDNCVNIGSFAATNGTWLAFAPRDPASPRPFYGISAELTVPTTVVPEPASLLLFGAGLLAAAMRQRRKSRR